MNLPPERKPDWEETQDYRGYTIELNFFNNPRSVSMHAYVAKGGTRVIVPFSEVMPIRDFATKEDARKIGVVAAQREIDAILKAA
jgi:hypothetical protein